MKRNYMKLNELKTIIDNLTDNCPDYTTEEQWGNHNYKVTVAMQTWCDEYNKVDDGKSARVENRTIILN
jgi:hypothetical protein